LCLVSVQAWAQVSPGPLARPHSDLDGTKNCFKCHGGGDSSMDGQCTACHREIAGQIERGRGLHGKEASSACGSCHPDHAGRDFEMISWDEGSPEQFDHTRADWPLEGRHAAIACRECHQTKYQSSPVADLLARKQSEKSWLGLERRCLACHDDYHQDTLGGNCLACHDEGGWKPAPKFDHSRSAFDLAGKHATVDCAKCHLVQDRVFLIGRNEQPIPRYKAVAHQDCADCHSDPHAGRLGPTCAGCHVVQDFHQVVTASFDHSRTNYSLVGRHASVDCERCHDQTRGWGKTPPYETCSGCHADSHAGQATLAGRVVDCDACHDPLGFRPATYSAEQHRTARYLLEGRHLEARCESCHLRDARAGSREQLGSAGVQLRPAYETCRDCHRDLHSGQLASRSDGGACESCHQVEDWKPSSYSAAQHALLELPLTGRHGEAKCAACHGPLREGLPSLPGAEQLGPAGVSLTLLDAGCETCHFDPHKGRFAADGPRATSGDCLGCHDVLRFRPAAVDVEVHQSFGYPLLGGHRAVPCVECHAELKNQPARIHLLEVQGTARDLSFSTEHETCLACHKASHGDQFKHRSDGGACEGCHTLDSFRPAPRFDHERDARFALQPAHRDLPCAQCHPSQDIRTGGREMIFRPLPRRCRDCHGKNVPDKRVRLAIPRGVG